MTRVRKPRRWKIRHQRWGRFLLTQFNKIFAEGRPRTHISKVRDKEFDQISKVEVLFKLTQQEFVNTGLCRTNIGQRLM